MIQRIQTLWLLIAAAFAFLSLKLSFFSGQKIVNEVAAHVELNAATADNLLVLISSVAVGLLALIAVFLFKQRKPQLRLVIVALLLSIVNIVLFIMEAQKFIPHQGNYSLTSVFVFLTPVFLILAARGISKDEKLIKSLDRLR